MIVYTATKQQFVDDVRFRQKARPSSCQKKGLMQVLLTGKVEVV